MDKEGFDIEMVTQDYFDDDTGNNTYRVECTVIRLNQWTVEMYQKAYGFHRSELSESERRKLQRSFQSKVMERLYGDIELTDYNHTIDKTSIADVMIVTMTKKI